MKRTNRFYYIIFFLLTFVQSVKAQEKTDNTYGTEGSRETVDKRDTVRSGLVFKDRITDPNGTLRYEKTIMRNDLGTEVIEINYYNCKGKEVYTSQMIKTILGKEESFIEIVYNEDGERKDGLNTQYDKDNKIFKRKYDQRTGEWLSVPDNYSNPALPNGNYKPDTTPCPPKTSGKITGTGDADLYVGFTVIDEDSKPKNFPTYGGTIGYMHPIGHSLGLTAKANINFGSNQGVDYRKISALAGLVVYPFKGADRNDKFQFSLEGLGGYVNLHANFGPVSTSSSGFILLVQPLAGIRISEHIVLQAGIGYNPTFISGNTANNWIGEIRTNFRF